VSVETEDLLKARIVTCFNNTLGIEFSGYSNYDLADLVLDAIRSQRLVVIGDEFLKIREIEDRDTFDGVPYMALTTEPYEGDE
jgi:hypothetical protein